MLAGTGIAHSVAFIAIDIDEHVRATCFLVGDIQRCALTLFLTDSICAVNFGNGRLEWMESIPCRIAALYDPAPVLTIAIPGMGLIDVAAVYAWVTLWHGRFDDHVWWV